jgi:hypothetical protein
MNSLLSPIQIWKSHLKNTSGDIPEASQPLPETANEDYSFLDDLQVFGVSSGHVNHKSQTSEPSGKNDIYELQTPELSYEHINHNSQTPGLSSKHILDPQTPELSYEYANPQIDLDNAIIFDGSELLDNDYTSKSHGNSPVLQQTDDEFFQQL